jgi:hypothetical protein
MHVVALLEDSPATRKDESKPNIIIGRDLIKGSGLTLDFAAEPPTISWEDATVPIVPRGYWTKDRLQEIFPISAISAAERNFKEKSLSIWPHCMEKNRWICVP